MKNLAWWSLALLAGCGGAAYRYESGAGSAEVAVATRAEGYDVAEDAAPAAPPPAEPDIGAVMALESEADGGGEMDSWDSWGDDEANRATVATPAGMPERPQLAQNQTGAGQQPGQTQQPPERTDAIDPSQPLLIYTAQIHLGVYQVEATQETIIGAITEVNGFIAQRTDNMLVVRVPAERFQQVLDKIEEAGDVLHRQVEALDVSEEFRDIAIRIRNAEAMRDRLEQLLRQANNVQEALAVERELQRLTESIEQMKGRQRWLADRIAFSTITIHFQPRATETIDPDPFRLPFQWLDTLGLRNLLSL